MPKTRYKVFRRSENTNSFGLFGMWLVGETKRDCWEVAANSLNAKKVGDVLTVPTDESGTPDFAGFGFEIPEFKATMPPEVLAEVWPDVEPKAPVIEPEFKD